MSKRLHMVGNAHIDPVWLWTAAEGRQEVIDTCRSALERMRETEEFVFCRSSAATYQWLEAAAQSTFREVKARIAEGRWIPVGGWWVQPDCNLPSGESFVRQGLIGKAYFRDRFDIDVVVGYNVDTFGHAWSLPQISAGMGLRYYVFFRPGPHEKELPCWVFWWEAPDGSRVLAARPPGHYNTGPHDIAARVHEATAAIPQGLNDGVAFYGVGNHGGGPTRDNIASIIALRRDPNLPELVFSHPRAFFEAVHGADTDLPVVRDELQHHARGCYTSLGAIKAANRAAESALLSAETWTAVARVLVGRKIESDQIRGAWETVLFNQFHDILAGTSIRAACDDAIGQNRAVIGSANKIARDAAGAVAGSVETADCAQSGAVIIFNPLGWARDDLLTAEVNWRASAPGIAVEAVDGTPLGSQALASHWSGGGRSVRVLVQGRIEPCGYTTLRIRPADEVEQIAPGTEDGRRLTNGLLEVEFGSGPDWIASLADLEAGLEVSGPGCGGLVVLDDPSDTWSHGVDRFRNEIGMFEVVGEPEVLGWGPLRWTVRLEGRWGASSAYQEFSLDNGRKQVNVRLELDWQEKHRMLKLRLPTRVQEGEATFEVPYGAIVRPASGDEGPAQRWVDLSGRVATPTGEVPYGVALLNDCKYGFDVQGGEIRMSVVRSPIYAFHDPAEVMPGECYEYTDQGRHVLRYAIVPHADTWREAQIVRRAAEFNRPCLVLQEPSHGGPLPRCYTFVATDCPNIDVEAVKPAATEGRTIIRLRETIGQATECQVGLDGSTKVLVAFAPWQIKTLAAERSGREWRTWETDLLEQPLQPT